jgi:hypothetical protein
MKVWMYHKNTPHGEIFDSNAVDLAELNDLGWVNTPANLAIKKEVSVTVDQAKEANPETLIELVKSLGFIVMTEQQFDAEVNKLSFSQKSLESFSDAELIAEAESRGLKESSDADDHLSLLERFGVEPAALTIPELVELGNDKFKLGLRSNMKEATLIEKILAAME